MENNKTKKQERDALELIERTLNWLGEGSYVYEAFKGCVEVAHENIDCDFMCSPWNEKLSAERKVAELSAALDRIQALIRIVR